ncbi:hypothetical protein K443DRAFT_95119 [Laccaria amethystina LaAM-08-1]|uniref:Uncharacterized protein n=1 Tax=Laccaria amethystina LaAM-08-1 TaxID=1095629 RepID=A0A0C9XPD6_9AGAR|nr:hypothetical protein K443DRAFT_95119 [Laccaria amethystina LaAM-08-1]
MASNYNARGPHSPNRWDSVFCSAGGVSIPNTFKGHMAIWCNESATQHNFFPPFLFSPITILHPSASQHHLAVSFL